MRLKKENGWIPKKRGPSKCRKAVYCIELNKIYGCAKEACAQLNLNIAHEKRIRDFCNKKCAKPIFGYTWR